MYKYLLKAEDLYRVETVADVEKLHEELLKDSNFQLVAFSYKTKQLKAKDNFEEYQIVKATKVFTDEKLPDRIINVSYSTPKEEMGVDF